MLVDCDNLKPEFFKLKMKLIVASLLFMAVPTILTSFAPSIEDELHNLEAECSKESGLDADKVENVRHNSEVPDEEAANKWAKCMLQKHNVIKSDGSINLDVSSITIPADTNTVILAFPTCSKLTGKDIDDTARLMFNCYRNHSGGILMAYGSRKTHQK